LKKIVIGEEDNELGYLDGFVLNDLDVFVCKSLKIIGHLNSYQFLV